MKNLLVGQSGGPTAVINSSLAGVIHRAQKAEEIGKVYGAVNGVEGILAENIISLNDMTEEEINLLKQTPSSYLGSCRKKLPEDLTDPLYDDIFGIFEKFDIGYFLYIGGNDSMDTVKKLSAYAKTHKSSVQFIGVPKTIDNDLTLTDHTPGFGSAAKFIVNSIRQLYLDTSVYSMKSVIVLEIMGRNAGWLTAAAALANSGDISPVDIICLPEVPFSKDAFLEKLKAVTDRKNTTIIAVSEGIKDEQGRYIAESDSFKASSKDGFAHAALGGVGKIIEKLITTELGIKTRSIELSTLQRCYSLGGSKTDIDEAFSVGEFAADLAFSGKTGVMAGFERISSNPYIMNMAAFDIEKVANFEKGVPSEMIGKDRLSVTDAFLEYAAPLIVGEQPLIFKDGLLQLAVRR